MTQKFNWKSFVSFALFWTFLIIVLSGIVLFVAPPGRISNWTNWTLLGFTKSQWQSVHTIITFSFAILSIFHLFFLNWNVFWSYIRKKSTAGFARYREFLISTLLVILFFAGAWFKFQPFGAVMEYGESLKNGWEVNGPPSPVAHAELLTVEQLSLKYLSVNPDTVLRLIREDGWKVSGSQQTLAQIGEFNQITPSELYNRILAKTKSNIKNVDTGLPVQGIGRKTVKELSVELGKDVQVILRQLEAAGIKASSEDKIRAVAENAGISPVELYNLVR